LEKFQWGGKHPHVSFTGRSQKRLKDDCGGKKWGRDRGVSSSHGYGDLGQPARLMWGESRNNKIGEEKKAEIKQENYKATQGDPQRLFPSYQQVKNQKNWLDSGP